MDSFRCKLSRYTGFGLFKERLPNLLPQLNQYVKSGTDVAFKLFLSFLKPRIETLRSYGFIGERTINFVLFLKKINGMLRNAIKKLIGFVFNVRKTAEKDLSKQTKNQQKPEMQIKREPHIHTIETVIQKNIKRATKNHVYTEGSSDILNNIPFKLEEMMKRRR